MRSAPDRHLAAFLEPRGNSGVNCLSFLALDVYSVSVRFTRAKAFKRSIGEAMRWGEKRKGREERCLAGSLRPRSPTTDVSTIGVERSPTGVNCTCSPSFLETKRSQVLLHPLSTHMHTKVSKVYFRLPPLWKIASGVLCMGEAQLLPS